jgi:YidC/Oxa1 family membrane protein insertase
LNLGENKRVIVAFALTFLIVLLWRPLMSRFGLTPETPAPESGTPAPNPAPAASGAPNAAPGQPAAASAGSTVAPSKPAKPAAGLVPIQGKQAEDVVVENDLYRITFDSQGAVIKSWILKKYTDANNKPLDLVNQEAAGQLGRPMQLVLPDSGLAGRLNSAIYAVSAATPGTLSSPLEAPTQVKFTYSDRQTEVQKIFSFGNSYQVDVQVSALDAQGSAIAVGVAWPGGFGDYSLGPKTLSSNSQAVYDLGGDVTKIKESKLKGPQSISGTLNYGGLEDHYFVDIFLPRSPGDVFAINRQSWKPANWTDKDLPAPFEVELTSKQAQPLDFGLFVAPKDLDLLKAMNPPLDNLVEFGVFKILAEPLFIGLRYIYNHWVRNYGWAIVILTVLINLALFPLKIKGIHLAQKQQKVAPIVKRIQDKYKQYKMNDPRKQKMNQEVMAVYKQYGINPLGGCLPMVLQLPLIYGFYEVLGTVIELRHAPWLGCVRDLSLPDACHPFGFPLALLPTLMIISMFVMQRMTPMATTDPTQQRMMYFMPLLFGTIFYRLASGVVLYYMTANLVGIAQQLIINRFIPHSPVVAPAPEAKSAESSGAAKTSGKGQGGGARKPLPAKN